MQALRAILFLSIVFTGGEGSINFCGPNQDKFPCYHDIGLPGDYCPGVKPFHCSGTQKRCACIQGFSWTWDRRCVRHRECVSRSNNPGTAATRMRSALLLLQSKEDLFLVGLSAGVIDLEQYKCFKSTFVTKFRGEGQPRMVHYDKRAGNEWKWTNSLIQGPKQYLTRLLRYRRLRTCLPYIHEALPERVTKIGFSQFFSRRVRVSMRVLGGGWTIGLSNENSKLPPKITFPALGDLRYDASYPVLHANEHCIILASFPRFGEKSDCTYWVQRRNLDERFWSCDFIFDEYCKAQRIILNGATLATCVNENPAMIRKKLPQ